MVTGGRPFGGGSTAEMLASLLKEQPKPPSELVPDVPKELERIILRCLRKEPARRFQHMTDLKVELEEVKEESDSQASAPTGAAAKKRRTRRRGVALAAAGLVVLPTAAAVWWHLRRGERPTPRLVQLTLVRHAHRGSFSPDGSHVAFAAAGERGGDYDIWLKIVGEAAARRLTAGPANDLFPAWSPDGKQIAFVRFAPGASAGAVYLVSPLGGPERRLSDFPVWWCGLSWSPDGHWLAVSNARAEGDMTPGSGGIHLIPAGGGEPHPVTFPTPPYADSYPAFSPNGRALAFFSCLQFRARCDQHVLPLDAEFRPAGAPRRLPPQKVDAYGLAWTHDGRSILYGVSWEDRLWRVRADGDSPPERVELSGRGAYGPITVASRDRLGVIRDGADFDIYKFQMGSTAATPLIASTVFELYPQYSSDGQRMAFVASGPGESPAVWLADADGSNLTRLTRGPGRAQTSPGWSPDGRTIVFEARAEDGHWGRMDERRRGRRAAADHPPRWRPRSCELVARRPLDLLHVESHGSRRDLARRGPQRHRTADHTRGWLSAVREPGWPDPLLQEIWGRRSPSGKTHSRRRGANHRPVCPWTGLCGRTGGCLPCRLCSSPHLASTTGPALLGRQDGTGSASRHARRRAHRSPPERLSGRPERSLHAFHWRRRSDDDRELPLNSDAPRCRDSARAVRGDRRQGNRILRPGSGIRPGGVL